MSAFVWIGTYVIGIKELDPVSIVDKGNISISTPSSTPSYVFISNVNCKTGFGNYDDFEDTTSHYTSILGRRWS